ncbi:hypothetical protein V5799_026726 [Amblyomma americanum]|uniref:Secreted protein n=1 Tax=Amblyomma americanum TaxID=6943 RepID=A0AAQ4DHR9_AMBAM
MLYGGLGFLLAQSLLNGADAVAQIKDATENHSPLAKESARLAQAASCPDSNIDKGTLFPYLPALEAAHAAFVELRRQPTAPTCG